MTFALRTNRDPAPNQLIMSAALPGSPGARTRRRQPVLLPSKSSRPSFTPHAPRSTSSPPSPERSVAAPIAHRDRPLDPELRPARHRLPDPHPALAERRRVIFLRSVDL